MNVQIEQQAAEAQIKVLYQQMADLHAQVKAAQEKLRGLPTIGKTVTVPGYFRGTGRVKEVCGAYVVVEFSEVTSIIVKVRASWVKVIEREAVPMKPRLWQQDGNKLRLPRASALVPAADIEAELQQRVAQAIQESNMRIAARKLELRQERLERQGKIIGGTYVIRPD